MHIAFNCVCYIILQVFLLIFSRVFISISFRSIYEITSQSNNVTEANLWKYIASNMRTYLLLLSDNSFTFQVKKYIFSLEADFANKAVKADVHVNVESQMIPFRNLVTSWNYYYSILLFGRITLHHVVLVRLVAFTNNHEFQ